jgi:Erythromycin esterase
MGFSVFAIEANMTEAYRVNDYIERGEGDPKQLLKGMYFWTWDTQEVLDMILWMRKFNHSGRGHIRFAGFDMQVPDISVAIVRRFVEQQDVADKQTAARVVEGVGDLRRSEMGWPASGVATASFPLALAAGRHLTFSGYIRTEAITEGYAGLWWRVDGEPGQTLAFDNMQDRGAKGTTPWRRYEISLDVPARAQNINFGVSHRGNGTAWFDSLKVDVDGKPYKDSSVMDFDFESPTPRGFYTHGEGYEIALDKTVAHGGSQSLRIQFLRTPPDPGEMDVQRVEAACRLLLEHLEARHAQLVKESSEKDTDWAIQNARLILQYVQWKDGEKIRDECMAENVQWIAAHSAGAKLILWAHNDHVTYRRHPGDEHNRPMGWFLRRLFGKKLVNFGFGFNEGSFRSVEKGKGCTRSRSGRPPRARWTARWRTPEFPSSLSTCAVLRARGRSGSFCRSHILHAASGQPTATPSPLPFG